MRRNIAIVLGALIAFAVPSALALAADPTAISRGERVPGARALEGRLIAPCCWTQTLDIHDSPIAEQLRAEISKRLQAGEPAAKIEDDLAARYGEQIRAVPRGEDPRNAVPVIVGGAMALAVGWLTWLGLAWLRRSRARNSDPVTTTNSQQYDQQLDDELKHLSDIS